MSREAMKELVRANTKCTDEAVGAWLALYAQGRLDERRRAVFDEHLCECLQCMALYNVETKHRHGYIDPDRTPARRLKVTLLAWLPPRKQIIAALSLLVLAVSCAATRTAYWGRQEVGTSLETPSNELSTLRLSPPSSPDNEGATNSTKRSAYVLDQARRGDSLIWLRIQTIEHTKMRDDSPVAPPRPQTSARPTPSPEVPRRADESVRRVCAEIEPRREEQRPKVKPVETAGNEVADSILAQPNDVSNGIQTPGGYAQTPTDYEYENWNGAKSGYV
ncbi:MAG TPA: hypothetical protein VNZ44_13735, partial [Pyrinomonadaceae bacterium]|nr:hypothetical protein [Pyrinomonadaceae bacterium]